MGFCRLLLVVYILYLVGFERLENKESEKRCINQGGYVFQTLLTTFSVLPPSSTEIVSTV